MPLRFSSSASAVRLQRIFHSSAIQLSNKKNYYEILQVPATATPAEVKQSFYALSKTHHPDRNPTDPNSSQRFVEISEAYATLCIPAKRQAYDRDHIQHHQSRAHHRPTGSYSSSHSPAGGRPASGLSRRRTQFTGPPPSFYRSGGWGEHSAKRKQAQENGAPGSEKPNFGENINPDGSPIGGTAGGMGYGDSPIGRGVENDVPHFDREGHYRTHRNQEERRRLRRRFGPKGEYVEGPGGIMANFVMVGIIIGMVAFVPTFLIRQ